METITPKECSGVIREHKNTVLVDVREPFEYNELHVPGSINIPLSEIHTHVDELSTYDKIFTICATGIRSAQASSFLVDNGLSVANVEGGIVAWRRAGFL